MKLSKKLLSLAGAAGLELALSVPTVAHVAQQSGLPEAANAEDLSDMPEAWIEPETDSLMIREDLDPTDIVYGIAPPTLEPLNVSGIVTAGNCQDRHGADYPHVTWNEASVHGWWVDVNGQCGETAKVVSKLQAWGCWNNTVCYWRDVVQGAQVDIPPGSGTPRANSRDACASTAQVSWRGLTDVDIHWVVDPFGWYIGPQQLLNCYPTH